LIERIAKMNLILQDHARRIHDHETDVRRIHDHFAGVIVLFYGILVCSVANRLNCKTLNPYLFYFILFSNK